MKKAIEYLEMSLNERESWYKHRGRVSIKDMLQHDTWVVHCKWAIKELKKAEEKE